MTNHTPTSPLPDCQLLTPAEAASVLRVSQQTLKRWAKDGLIDRLVLNSRVTGYTAESVTALVEEASP